MLLSRL